MRFAEIIRIPLVERAEDIVAALSSYKGDPDIYITFSDLPKFGIYPQYPHSTPLGIYAYPLNEIWEDIVHDSIPYAGERQYVIVSRAVGRMLNLSAYTEADFTRDFEALRIRYGEIIQARAHHKTVDEAWEELRKNASRLAHVKTPAGRFWYVTREIAIALQSLKKARISIVWNGVLRSLGYDGVLDKDGLGIIHINEPIQAVFLSAKAAQLIAVLENARIVDGRRKLNRLTIHSVSLNSLSYWVEDEFRADRGISKTLLRFLKEWPAFVSRGHSRHFVVKNHEQLLSSTNQQFKRFMLTMHNIFEIDAWPSLLGFGLKHVPFPHLVESIQNVLNNTDTYPFNYSDGKNKKYIVTVRWLCEIAGRLDGSTGRSLLENFFRSVLHTNLRVTFLNDLYQRIPKLADFISQDELMRIAQEEQIRAVA